MNQCVEGVPVGGYSMTNETRELLQGVETDQHKPGYQSATEDNEIAPLHITTMFCIRLRIGTLWLYAVFCICMPHIAKRLYSEVMLNINNECNGKTDKVLVAFQGTKLFCFCRVGFTHSQEKRVRVSVISPFHDKPQVLLSYRWKFFYRKEVLRYL